MKYLYLLIIVGMVSVSCHQTEDIDWDDPEVIEALEDIYYHMDENLPVYAIKIDTLGLWEPHTMVLQLTVLKNGEAVYDDVRYEVLCAG